MVLKPSAKHHFAIGNAFTKAAACEISDIVKRRSIRAWIAKHIARYALRILALSPDRFRRLSIVRCAGCKTILLALLDRDAIGPILRSNLVFLIISSCMQSLSRGRADDLRIMSRHAANILPSVWILIMRAIKCLKGVRWMPWR